MPELLPRARSSQESVFARMSRLAAQHGAINLGQGFPSDSPPAFLLEAARQAVGTLDQYAPPAGLPALRDALGADLGVDGVDVVVTTGATEAMGLLAQALYGPGDEVLMLEPVFDIYLPQARLAGATPVTVPLRLTAEGGWTLDLDELRAAVTPRTRALLLNSPHNPTGRVFTREELEAVAALARQHDLWLISDEVYDELYFGERPLGLRTLAPERTFTVGSAGKRLEATGWRVGWVACPPGYVGNLTGLRQVASFCAPTPFQAAVAAALPVARQSGFYEGLREGYAARLDLLAGGLRDLGAEVFRPGGTYFLMARRPGWEAGTLVERAGVAVIPGEAFAAREPALKGLFRLAFCKSQAELEQALERLGRFVQADREAEHRPV
ncbi:aminotransferase class I/II-fold pyridoxal phosphate-dependent enzyme [Deinococcus metallilatus]|uniref:Aminotransferase class I/II-fold pyridoxal phosphate-dependent enzyme n=1 Tax=Deinococcus metallilatus TaxID=1211322 RepID=A0AAJ5JXQ6_9DEIO|nr:aminotransferase class I/II-fold pyridoxal phosphate-dependent enzyme [Deinococcus metallilatus]MBB5296178.1 N-succinyldiaminopimelate aminotransferase [Deinococcus metallilatus]QBY09773.1 aminotransferase class I/II-fold pyridoxal phosphate-dependent enzyme [Deinococcus metallilatus]RXJ08971.1 aminotransferase class I/II-fold pyridoxal phosphate-dependent enzyme [Deinococcus metallilatus]TLK23650.1 aminotransferase class I/II-fold pyridoxal phosphate-dependent enzyme [Deinococcus metallilat